MTLRPFMLFAHSAHQWRQGHIKWEAGYKRIQTGGLYCPYFIKSYICVHIIYNNCLCSKAYIFSCGVFNFYGRIF